MSCNRTHIMRACTVLYYSYVISLHNSRCVYGCLGSYAHGKIPIFSVVVITVSRCSVFQLNKANVYLLALVYSITHI